MIACIFCGGIEFLVLGIIAGLLWFCNIIRKLLGHSVKHKHDCPNCLCCNGENNNEICGIIKDETDQKG